MTLSTINLTGMNTNQINNQLGWPPGEHKPATTRAVRITFGLID